MPFTLTKLDDEVFQATKDKKVTFKLHANRGEVELLSARYGNQHSTDNPVEFTLGPNTSDLIIIFQATNNDAQVRLSEVDGAQQQRLTVRPAFDASLSIEIQMLATAVVAKV